MAQKNVLNDVTVAFDPNQVILECRVDVWDGMKFPVGVER